MVLSVMTIIRWRLNDILQANNLTAYKLEQAVRGNVSRNTIYRWAKETPQLLDLAALPHVMEALERLTGKVVTPNDLLEVLPEQNPPKKKPNTRLEALLKNSKPALTKATFERKFDISPEESIAFDTAMNGLQAEKDKTRGNVSAREKEMLGILRKKSK